MKRIIELLCGAAVLLMAGTATSHVYAQTASGRALFAYPMKGQTPEQETADRAACHDWAVAQTGYDPTLVYKAQQYGITIERGPSGASYENPTFPRSGGFSGALTKAEIRHLNELYDAYLRAGQVCLEARGYQVTR
jgi:hypothetical protein